MPSCFILRMAAARASDPSKDSTSLRYMGSMGCNSSGLSNIRLGKMRNATMRTAACQIGDSPLFASTLDPAKRILLILDPRCRARDLERMERIHHHRQLLGAIFADAGLGGAGVRAMRQAAWVQRDAGLLDALARHKIPLDVVQHLVAVHI